jgi:two-component system OmpR family response regulator
VRLLLVADIHRTTYDLCAGLESHGFAVTHCDDVRVGLSRACTQDWRVIVLDATMAWQDAAVLLEKLRAHGTAAPVIVLTAPNDVAAGINSLRLGADDCLDKPFEIGELVARITTVLQRITPAEPKA